jgi:imidazolonepropionase-like amidohydrolase
MRRYGAAAAVSLALAVTVLGAGPVSAQGSDRLAIVGGYLIDGTEAPPVRDAVVLVEGERISHVGRVSDTEIPSGYRVVDAEGYTVMPGLSDSHVHLLLIGHGVYGEYFPRYHYEQNRMREFMEISAPQLLMAGVTSARDLAALTEDAVWIRDEIDAGRIVGPRLLVTGNFLQKTTPPGQAFVRTLVDGPEDAARKTRELIDTGVDMIKVIQLARMTREERMAIAEEAHAAGRQIVVHASTLEEVRAAAEMGARSIEHVGAGRKPLREAESIKLMADHGIFYSPTSIVSRIYDITTAYPERLDERQLSRDLPPDVFEDVRESIRWPGRLGYFEGAKDANRTHAAKIRQAYDGGVRLVIGTDSGTPMNFHWESTWQEMDLFVSYGIPPMKVISMATRHFADLVGMSDDLGTIEPGKLADIIVVDGNPLRHMSALDQRNVLYVFKGGVQYKPALASASN